MAVGRRAEGSAVRVDPKVCLTVATGQVARLPLKNLVDARDGWMRVTPRTLSGAGSAIAVRIALSLLLAGMPACRQRELQQHYAGSGKDAVFVDRATKIAYPDVIQQTAGEVTFSTEPRRLRNRERDEIWDLTLQEAIFLALCNSEVIRTSATFLSPGNPLLNNPAGVSSVYDSALQETGTLFGNRGVEAALSEFDAQFTTSMIWGRNETVQNNLFSSGGLAPGDTLQEDTGDFRTGIEKRFATGAQFGVSHSWNYSYNNSPARLFPSVYEGDVRAEFRQPLLAGAGAEYTRIAGPISENIQGVTGVQQGVLIARIGNDIALADFEQSVHQLLLDVESLYWQLSLAYQTFHLQAKTRDRVLEMWQLVDARLGGGAAGGGRLPEAETRESYLQLRTSTEAALDNIYSLEAQLRRIMGLPINDGRVIRPSDQPVTAEVLPDWVSSLGSALAQRPELRRQKWSIKATELQLQAARSLLMPRLDLVAAAQANGFGDNLLGDVDDGVTNSGLGSAYDRLAAGDQTGWTLGMEFSTPIGRRFAHTQVRNLELQLAKGRKVLEQQEVEVSHELAAAFRDIDRTWLAMQNAYSRIAAASERLQAVLDRSLPNDFSVDPVLRAQEALLQAELNYQVSVAEYNTALAELSYRTGRTLEVNCVSLAEGSWKAGAVKDAQDHHQARRFGIDSPWKEETSAPFAHPSHQGPLSLPAMSPVPADGSPAASAGG